MRAILAVLGVVVAVAAAIALGGLFASSSTTATVTVNEAAQPVDFEFPSIAVADLPPEARQTLELIDRGGPFPYSKDGSTFGNREGLLPSASRGYYREYTVPTPGEDDRGARRIVTGDDDREFFYTDDHYASFSVILR
ncbi:MAG: ribonuclease domain-containing protein [Thermoleophilia bacterium]